MKIRIFFGCILGLCLFFVGCQRLSDQQIGDYIKENPEVVMAVLEKNPGKVLKILKKAQLEEIKKQQELKRAAELKTPRKPIIAKTRPLMPGSVENALITIVVYSDFQCPHCEIAAKNLKDLIRHYEGKTKVVFKHSTRTQLSFQEALFFEAAGMQDARLAWALHDYMFENRSTIQADERLLEQGIDRVGLDKKQLYTDVNSALVREHLESDMKEVKDFNIYGTPTFIINGVTLEGSVPVEEMMKVVELTLE
jgi:protein-disulfide isomerase